MKTKPLVACATIVTLTGGIFSFVIRGKKKPLTSRFFDSVFKKEVKKGFLIVYGFGISIRLLSEHLIFRMDSIY